MIYFIWLLAVIGWFWLVNYVIDMAILVIPKLYWRLYIIRLASRWINKPNLGDEVIYKDAKWVLIQGVCAPVWSLVRGDDGEPAERVDVHEKDFYKVRTPSSIWRSFRSGYRFYMTNWYSIWLREGIKPWMLECTIWFGKKPKVRA